MQTFDEWWEANKHMLPHIVKIDAREAYNAALTAANERIRELEATRDIWYGKATGRAIELNAERAISDKLVEAINGILAITDRKHVAWDAVHTALAEVAAMRKEAEHE